MRFFENYEILISYYFDPYTSLAINRVKFQGDYDDSQTFFKLDA